MRPKKASLLSRIVKVTLDEASGEASFVSLRHRSFEAPVLEVVTDASAFGQDLVRSPSSTTMTGQSLTAMQHRQSEGGIEITIAKASGLLA